MKGFLLKGGLFWGSALLSFVIILTFQTSLTEGIESMPKYQPELDQLSMEKYVTHERSFNLHINCLLFDGPCDAVGHWMKPRMASFLLGACIMCTPNQDKESAKFMTWLYENHPQLFRTGIAKYLEANGISLPEDSKFREQVQNMNIPKIASGEETEPSAEEVDDSQEEESPLRPPQEDKQQQQQQQHLNLQQHLPQQFQNQNQHQSQSSFLHGNNDQRVFNPNSRKNKFSAAMMAPQRHPQYHGGSHSRMTEEVEDDEAEDAYEITTQQLS